MLHIKLPKGKVSQACERAAEEATRRIVVENDRYRRELEVWRKMTPEFARWNVEAEAPIRSKDVELLIEDRDKLHAMADMAKHSVGDVYVSPELWRAIKGVY